MPPSAAVDPVHAQVAQVFNLAAPDYDGPALRFFPFCADRLVTRLNPAAGEKILDVATGTGAVALAAAQAVGPAGRVIGIDLAEGMLAQLQRKLDKFGIAHVDLHVMDAAALEFRGDYFHHTLCSFGLCFVRDMAAALKDWVRVTRPGGKLMFTAFGLTAFEPMKRLLLERLQREGIDAGAPVQAAGRLAEAGNCQALLAAAGFDGITVETAQLGYHLRQADEWWEIVWGSGFRGLVEKLPPARREAFRSAHLAELAPLATNKGLWLDVEVIIAGGTKP
ncbi:MAG: hypothetical protein A2V91_05415 [Candidatus Muproteobacteria bacterium RBG_16_64_10]|uniref:Methyltransferase domain-containing protein n=1 Tax=Candidatus Muproteobacteria bacterium RBG_16_64_10 TaxID=1817757 RepID=A0A1F6T1W9_9PROT|nr:MAG: hypothetical protein A2V91_05415 [Candidatus Muproteobacteria bacterium RBG_16_64_10]